MASANRFLTFYSVSPTNLLNNSGPFTILGSLACNTFPNYLAIKVLPVPGGPYNNNPLICLIPYISRMAVGILLDEKALLKMSYISLSNPPTPISSNLKSGLNKVLSLLDLFLIFNNYEFFEEYSKSVSDDN